MSEPDKSWAVPAVRPENHAGDLSAMVRASSNARDPALDAARYPLLPDEEDLAPWPEGLPDGKPVALRLRPENTAIRWTLCRDRDCRRHRQCMLPPAWCANPRAVRPRNPVQSAGASDHLLRRVKALEQHIVEQRKAQPAAARPQRRQQPSWPRP